MSNPFEDDDAPYAVLVNEEGQHSLWPVFADVPAGWREVFRGERKADCTDYIERNWTDMRPRSLAEAMDRQAGN